MSNTKQILSMLRSRAEGDEDQFLAIALQVAAAEARQGRRSNAEQLRAAVEDLRRSRGDKPSVRVSLARPRGDLEGLLDLREPRLKLSQVVLAGPLREKLDRVVVQQDRRAWLREGNRTPSRRLLFAGPPGSGKTLTAEALAGELRLPFFVVRLEGLITRYMGETSAKLRLVFDETIKHRGVYLFDEFDAVGGRRDATNDVGEMRRVLNSFLQFMEEPTSTDSLVLAATNHPELLDRALQRRFDEVLSFDMPSPDEICEVIRNHLRPMKYPRIAWSKIVEAGSGLSQAELARAADEAAKVALLSERNVVRTEDLLQQLTARHDMRNIFNGNQEISG
ncbi:MULTISPECIES: AAA family ATPase [Paracoccus]|uniref:AAA family ATPase n=1 Tax=Paracoccus tegillarcae TaxID=1529068 RepID=A0A2K9EDL7_9RHOB|nr:MULTISPECIES: ATP-binding protein [Paracoccus]AUH32389.1 AAA family ATPase [Paracoccus tegillarcae]